ncbi:MAG: hypothetical protein IPQ23_02535 [Cytophagaceae bacterium]|nr:hypothetical protein [Cytophagaceae bacterium]
MTTLEFNVITFNHPSEDLTLYFSNKEQPNTIRIFHRLVPPELLTHFGEQEHYYMSLSPDIENSLNITKKTSPQFEIIFDEDGSEKKRFVENVSFSGSIMRRYYNSLIFDFFQSKGFLTKPNFVNDVEIWVPFNKDPDPLHNLYVKFTLKVQLARLSDYPEILITYEGVSKILKTSYFELMNRVRPSSFNWLEFEGQLYKYDLLPEQALRDLNRVFPVLSKGISVDLKYPALAPDRSNKYKTFKTYILGFCNKFLFNEDFEKIIPINNRSLLPVKIKTIDKVSKDSNQLVFGQNNKGIIPYEGIKVYGPAEIPKDKKICFFYIYHIENVAIFQKFDSFMSGGEAGFLGFSQFCKLGYYPDYSINIVFKNKSNPLPEIEAVLSDQKNFPSDVRYIAFYISPISKFTGVVEEKEIYYRVKETLLKRSITCQALDNNKVFSKGYNFSLPNISIAVLAKLFGTPWKLATTVKDELIVGIGAFKNYQTQTQYVGSAVSFSNTGTFNQMDCFLKNQTEELAGSIIIAVRKYAALNSTINRLIIHFYKNMSQEELNPIEQGLRDLDLNIPVFIISINKTESQDIVAFDNSWAELMPESGTFINLGRNKFLLFNNTRYGNTHKTHEGFPFPVKVSMYCTHESKLKSQNVVQELLDQVYQFSRMYWKSVSQQNLPITIKYPEMVAEIYSHFEGNEIPIFGNSNLWFL